MALLYRMQAGEGQAEGFVPAAGAVESLHGVACRALHQVVESGHDHDALLAGIQFKADVAVVAARQDFGFGIAIDPAALFDQSDERLALVRLAVNTPESALIHL